MFTKGTYVIGSLGAINSSISNTMFSPYYLAISVLRFLTWSSTALVELISLDSSKVTLSVSVARSLCPHALTNARAPIIIFLL